METATKKFIEDAIAGGWLEGFFYQSRNEDEIAFGSKRNDSENNPCHYRDLHQILLSPKAWKAVGKTRGWKTYTWTSWKGWDEHCIEYPTDEQEYNPPSENAYCQRHITWTFYMHRFIDHLAEGQTIDQALSNLI